MKRMACPACGKPLLLPEASAGKVLPCPTCSRQLTASRDGLAVLEEADSRSGATPVRPKPAMVPVTAPFRPQQAAVIVASPPPSGSSASLPVLPEKSQLASWLVPSAAVVGLVVVVATVATVPFILKPDADPEPDELAGPVIVDSLGRNVGRERTRPPPRDRPVGKQTVPPSQSNAETQERESSTSPQPAVEANSGVPVASGTASEGCDPIQAVLRSVAVVAMPGEGHGSGFVVAPGVLVTNHHVIEDAVISDLQITFPDNDALAGRPLRAELIHLSISDDLAFLAIDADVHPLGIKPHYEHINGQRVVAVGSPGSGVDGPTLENLTTDGRLGPELPLSDDGKRWALSMAVNGGNSGGPLLDAQSGDVLGVIVAKFTETEGQSLAIPHEALVRELAKARQASKDSREVVLSLHRQRYCLRQMAQILGLTSFAFDRSIAAALANTGKGADVMDAAFNECKTKTAAVFAEQFADFSGTVGGEVEDLQDDPDCDPRVRRGLRKLLSDIEDQADEIRRRVPSEQISDFLGRFRGSVAGSRALVKSLSERLEMKLPEPSEEEDEE
jgi:S1-C subfamily serine protease